MLKVEFSAKNDAISFSMKGHAGQAEVGHDIVCSACSILAYTIANVIKVEEKEGSFKNKPFVLLESGSAFIVCQPVEEKYDEILHAFYVTAVGFTLLAHNYPQFVELKSFGGAEEALK